MAEVKETPKLCIKCKTDLAGCTRDDGYCSVKCCMTQFHHIPEQDFIERQLNEMQWDIKVKLWKEIPKRGHDDDPADLKIDLSEFTKEAAVQELMDCKLALYKRAVFEPMTDGVRGQLWHFNGKHWTYRKRGKRTWIKVKTGDFDFLNDDQKEQQLNDVFLE